jgi:MFS family permease
MIFVPLSGRLFDKISRRKILLLRELWGYALSLELVVISNNIEFLCGHRALNGASQLHYCASAYIVDVIPLKFRARGLAWHGPSIGLGFVSGPAADSFVSDLVKDHPLHLSFIDFNAFSVSFLLALVLPVFSVIIAGVLQQE